MLRNTEHVVYWLSLSEAKSSRAFLWRPWHCITNLDVKLSIVGSQGFDGLDPCHWLPILCEGRISNFRSYHERRFAVSIIIGQLRLQRAVILMTAAIFWIHFWRTMPSRLWLIHHLHSAKIRYSHGALVLARMRDPFHRTRITICFYEFRFR